MSMRASRAGVDRQATGGLSYLLLYLPALLAWMVVPAPTVSYGLAWLGSWWIIGLSLTGAVRPIPNDRPLQDQLFRPLFLTQAMFAAYLCLTSIFYVWELAGSGGVEQVAEFERAVAAQRYSVLGHAALVHGILATMDYRRSGEWELNVNMTMPRLLLLAAGGALALMVVFEQAPGLGQFGGKLQTLAAVAAVFGFGYALRRGDWGVAVVGTGLYGYVLYIALLSGWKEATIVVVGLLLLTLYPKYKKTVIVVGAGAAVVLVTLLPAYNAIFRQLHWGQEVDAQTAAAEALDRLEREPIDLTQAAWDFLGGRAARISLFTDYIDYTPDHRPYYGFTIARQGIQSIIPRVLWPSKPVTENMVMERVYENRVVSAASTVSAKPSIVVDGYLSAGWIGVSIFCFLLGATAGVASQMAERWFGGYEIGGQIVFTGLFANQLHTASIEFLMNALFWSFVLMGLLAFGLWASGFLRRTGHLHPTASRAAPAART